MNYLAPSILAADFTKLGEQISIIEKSGVEMLHIDVMDGMFVPSISFGMPVVESIRKNSKLLFDVHLMIEEPDRYVETFAKLGADSITVHAETCTHLHRTIHHIKELGLKCSVALNPSTPLSVLDYVLQDLDMVLIMTVNPGFGGQAFIPEMYEKIRQLKNRITEKELKTDIQVDGGVCFENVQDVLDAGANVLVAGSSVFKGNIEENIAALQKALV